MFIVEPKQDTIEKDQVENLLSIYGAIYTQYAVLAKLEFENKQDSKEYQQSFENIKLGEEVAKRLFSKIDHFNDSIIQDLTDDYPNVDFHHDYLAITYNQDLLLTIRRFIVSTAYAKCLNEGLDKYNPAIPVEIRDNYFSYADYKLHKEFEVSELRSYLYYLEREINKEHNTDIRRRLIEKKYNLLFVNRAVNTDDEFFTPVTELKDNSNKIIKDFNISSERIEAFFNEIFGIQLNIAINNFINSEPFPKDLDDKASKASLACIIKSILFNTKEESIKCILFQLDALDEQINNKTKTEETRKRLELNRTMIRGMLKAVIKDKEEYFEKIRGEQNVKTK